MKSCNYSLIHTLVITLFFHFLTHCEIQETYSYLEEEVFCYISLQDFQYNLASNHSEASGFVHYRLHLYHKVLDMGQYIFDSDKPWFVDNLDFGYILDDKPKMDLQNNQEYRRAKPLMMRSTCD